ncbi:hypothetical protein L873DRAFT_1820626, partial [Choiromyces venosus 120613-1]
MMALESSRQLQITDNVNSLNFPTSLNVNLATSHNITVNAGANDETGEVLKWVPPLDLKNGIKACEIAGSMGVRSWLLETNEFRRWSNISIEGSQVQLVLFCYGFPGIGKTYL